MMTSSQISQIIRLAASRLEANGGGPSMSFKRWASIYFSSAYVYGWLNNYIPSLPASCWMIQSFKSSYSNSLSFAEWSRSRQPKFNQGLKANSQWYVMNDLSMPNSIDTVLYLNYHLKRYETMALLERSVFIPTSEERVLLIQFSENV